MCAKLDKEYLIKLTLAVYRVTELFPQEELKSQIRESANGILADLLLGKTNENGSRQLMGLFKEAEAKNWIDPRNFLVLYREYDRLLHSVEQPVAPLSGRNLSGRNPGKTVENSFPKNYNSKGNNHRLEKILEVVKENGRVRVKDLNQLFPQFHRRTLIRDLDKLCRSGMMVRVGSNGRGVYYRKNSKIM